MENDMFDLPVKVARKKRSITFDERKQIEDLLRKGYSIAEVALSLDRDYSVIYKEVIKKSDGQDYNAEKRQQICDESIKKKAANARQHKNGLLALQEKVDGLEICVKLLAEMVEKLQQNTGE